MDAIANGIHHGDCIAQLGQLAAGSVDLVFADPPFNIGYDYDLYQDSVEDQQYLDWSRDWMTAVYRVLKPDGTFWLAIGDEYAAELKVECRRIGFHCRSWVIWYYTFGVNCAKKFTRSHAHLFHFVKDPIRFTFRDEDLDNRVPSARELVYNDKRANPQGRLPDDTWIIRPADVVGELVADDPSTWRLDDLAAPSDTSRTYTLRPQDLEHCFRPAEDTWYFPRVAGTFKERAGFHGCQMPEQLLGRIIRTCSHPGDLVLDPFSGSATTLAVAKKLGRRYLGFELSPDYVRYGEQRLAAIHVGDPLDGSPEPLKSAPATRAGGRQRGNHNKPPRAGTAGDPATTERRYSEVQVELTLHGVRDAFLGTHQGFSADRVVADPELNASFVSACREQGLVGDARTWNTLLFRLRKSGQLERATATQMTAISWDDSDPYLFASEIALQRMLDSGLAQSLDELLCDPELAAQFDRAAAELAPGYSSLEYRWAALRLRKEAKQARSRAAVLVSPARFAPAVPLDEFDLAGLTDQPGVYVVSDQQQCKLYVGESLALRRRLMLQFGEPQRSVWSAIAEPLLIQTWMLSAPATGRLAWQSHLIQKYDRPRLNYTELCGATTTATT